MKFYVHWDDDANDGLAAAWTSTSDRMAVTTASAKIDRLLAADPLGHGTHVAEGLYALEVDPLRVYYEVDEPNHVVGVVSAGIIL
jgi:hypothetical protein